VVDPSPYFELMCILDLFSGESLLLVEERVFALVWSPDASKIAFEVAGPAADHLSWKVADSATGEVRKLVDSLSSNDPLVYLLFFDQYANSNSLWSPDSRQLTMSGQVFLTADGGNGVAPETRVYVLDVEWKDVTQAITAGSLASWSWG
jgi:Tol biopolymer transport system component